MTILRLKISFIFVILILSCSAFSQEITYLTLQQVIDLAKNQSYEAILAKHRFRASYWEYRTYKAELLPNLTLNASPFDLNRAIKKYQLPDGSYRYILENSNSSSMGLSLKQNIGLTGGNIFVSSNIERNDYFTDSSTSYLSNPFRIGFNQPLNGYNPLRWKKIIEPIKYEEAKRNYLLYMEQISIMAINYFFDLALAQVNHKMAQANYSNTDTLYKIAKGRYNIGTIAEDQLLQMELSFLNAGIELNQATLNLEVKKSQLRIFLGYNEKVNIELIIPKTIPLIEMDFKTVYNKAVNNNPSMLSFERQLQEAARDVARARSEKGLNMNLYGSYGLTQNAFDLKSAYNNPLDQQQVTIGLQVPILDWGLGKGKLQMAKSAQEVKQTSIAQEKIDFEQNVFLNVMQFNMQDDQFLIARKADTIAQIRYEVAKQRFLIGKISVLDLNVALTEKDQAQRRYIDALKNFWINYYNLRKLSLFDFEKQTDLMLEETGLL